MKIYGEENNQIILNELGKRIKDTRIAMNLTQSALAEKTGLGVKTIIRIESGENTSVENILNIFRILGLLQNLDILIPEQEILPTQMVDKFKKRKRATGDRVAEEINWKWGDE